MKSIIISILLLFSFSAVANNISLSVGDSADTLIEVLEQTCVSKAQYEVVDYGKYSKQLPHTTFVNCWTDSGFLLVVVKDAVVSGVDLL